MSFLKGDLAEISKPGKEHPKITERINTIGITDFKEKAREKRQCIIKTIAKSAAHSVGRQIATQLMRGLLGSFLKK